MGIVAYYGASGSVAVSSCSSQARCMPINVPAIAVVQAPGDPKRGQIYGGELEMRSDDWIE